MNFLSKNLIIAVMGVIRNLHSNSVFYTYASSIDGGNLWTLENGNAGAGGIWAEQIYETSIQPGDVTETYADIDNLIADTNFKPVISIEEGIPRFVDWFKWYKGY